MGISVDSQRSLRWVHRPKGSRMTANDADASAPEQAPKSFAELGLKQALLDALEEMGFEHPTPVQEEALPLALAGRDLLVQSQTDQVRPLHLFCLC